VILTTLFLVGAKNTDTSSLGLLSCAQPIYL
jgi:hypothetical protein